jgi:predicted RNA methylase
MNASNIARNFIYFGSVVDRISKKDTRKKIEHAKTATGISHEMLCSTALVTNMQHMYHVWNIMTPKNGT